jgi:hypothetical protein
MATKVCEKALRQDADDNGSQLRRQLALRGLFTTILASGCHRFAERGLRLTIAAPAGTRDCSRSRRMKSAASVADHYRHPNTNLVPKVLSRRSKPVYMYRMSVTLWCSLSTCWTAAEWLAYWLSLAVGLGLIVTALRAPAKRKDGPRIRWRALLHSLRRAGPRTDTSTPELDLGHRSIPRQSR